MGKKKKRELRTAVHPSIPRLSLPGGHPRAVIPAIPQLMEELENKRLARETERAQLAEEVIYATNSKHRTSPSNPFHLVHAPTPLLPISILRKHMPVIIYLLFELKKAPAHTPSADRQKQKSHFPPLK